MKLKELKLQPYQKELLEAFKDGEVYSFKPLKSKKVKSPLTRGAVRKFIHGDDRMKGDE